MRVCTPWGALLHPTAPHNPPVLARRMAGRLLAAHPPPLPSAGTIVPLQMPFPGEPGPRGCQFTTQTRVMPLSFRPGHGQNDSSQPSSVTFWKLINLWGHNGFYPMRVINLPLPAGVGWNGRGCVASLARDLKGP